MIAGGLVEIRWSASGLEFVEEDSSCIVDLALPQFIAMYLEEFTDAVDRSWLVWLGYSLLSYKCKLLLRGSLIDLRLLGLSFKCARFGVYHWISN